VGRARGAGEVVGVEGDDQALNDNEVAVITATLDVRLVA
jgi:hypothetical protein